MNEESKAFSALMSFVEWTTKDKSMEYLGAVSPNPAHACIDN